MDKDLIKGKLYQLIDQLHGRKINHKENDFGNEGTCSILLYLYLGVGNDAKLC